MSTRTPSASESSSTLLICLSRLDAAKAAYIKAHDAFLNVKSKDNGQADDRLFDRRAKEQDAQLLRSLGTVCDVARFGSQLGQLLSEDLHELVERAVTVENMLMQLSYGEDGEGNSHMACGNVLRDKATASLGGSMGIGSAKTMLPFFLSLSKSSGPVNEQELKAKMLGYSATPHKDTFKPSLYTSPLARYGIDPIIPGPSASSATSAFAEARCEIQSNNISRPTTMRLVGSVLIILGASGWKERSSVMTIRDLSSGDERDLFYSEKRYGLGQLSGPQLVVDDSRKLVYNDAEKVVHAYRYGSVREMDDQDVFMDESEGPVGDKGKSAEPASSDSDEDSEDLDDDGIFLDGQDGKDKLAFSLVTKGYKGVVCLASGGSKLLRTGPKGLGIWDIPTRRTGGKAGFTGLESDVFSGVEVMAEHPSDAQQRLVATCNDVYYVSSADVESGRVASRYVGHNREVTSFATSKEDPNNFITVSDGGVRFYDSRLPAPVYAIEHSHAEGLRSVLYEHVGGHPFIIIGGFKSQQVKIWDARGRAPLYELSTGNNVVEALAWDGSRNQLFAATDCEYMGYHGTHFDYREADFGDERGGDMAWPEKAYHDEESFGYPFDSGSHRLFRYSFKTKPDTEILPVYGDARPDRDGGGGFGGFGGMFGF